MSDSRVRGDGHDDWEGEREDDEKAGARASAPTDDVIEPGSPSAENAAFLLLGVLGALYVLARIAGLV